MSSTPRAREDQLSEDLSNDARIVHGRDESRLRLGLRFAAMCRSARARGESIEGLVQLITKTSLIQIQPPRRATTVVGTRHDVRDPGRRTRCLMPLRPLWISDGGRTAMAATKSELEPVFDRGHVFASKIAWFSA